MDLLGNINLRAEMVRANLTISEIHKKTGINPRTIAKVLDGIPVRLDLMIRISELIPTVTFHAAWVETNGKG